MSPPAGSLERAKDWIRYRPRVYRTLLRYLSPVHLGGREPALLLEAVGAEARVLNLGSGSLRHGRAPSAPGDGPAAINVDLRALPGVDLLADIACLPVASASIDGVISEVTLEHVPAPGRVVAEIERVLKPGAPIFVVVPFLQPFHASPDDFQRWTLRGLRELLGGFEEIEAGVRAGPTSAVIWTVSEWWGVVLSFGSARLRGGLAALFQVLLSPLKFLDAWIGRLPGASGVASALYYFGRKPRGKAAS